MAFNWERSPLINIGHELANGTSSFVMADTMFEGILTMMGDQDDAKLFLTGYSNLVQGFGSSFSVTLDGKNGNWKPKGSKIGDHSLVSHGTVKTVGGSFAFARKFEDAYFGTDLMRMDAQGLGNFFTIKIMNAMETLFKTEAMAIWQTLGHSKASTDSVKLALGLTEAYTTNTESEIKGMMNAIVMGALNLTRLRLPNGAIRGIKSSDIKIALDKALWQKFVELRLVSSSTSEEFNNGFQSVEYGSLGGYKVYLIDDVRPAHLKVDLTHYKDSNTLTTVTSPTGVPNKVYQHFKSYDDSDIKEHGLQTSDNYPIVGFIGTDRVGIAPIHIVGISRQKVAHTVNDECVIIEAELSGDKDRNENGFTAIFPETYVPIVTKDALTVVPTSS